MGNGERLAIAMANSEELEHKSLAMETLQQVPSAAKEMAQEAWDHPLQTAGHVALTLGTAAVAGKIFSMVIPARGPAAIATGLVFTIPLATREYLRWNRAYEMAKQPGADMDKIAHDLAKGTLGAAGDTALGFIGGTLGSKWGQATATSDTAMGRWSQEQQRKVLAAENKVLLGLKNLPETVAPRAGTVGVASAESFVAADASGATGATAAAGEKGGVWFAKKNSLMETRIGQLETTEAPQYIKAVGSMHSHSNLSDGTGSTLKNLQDAKAAGMQYYAVTDHNHLAARDGVRPGDPRAKDEAGIPILASDPKAYAQQFIDAVNASKDGEFVGVIGVEMGTIGHVGGPKHGGSSGGGGKGAEVAGAAENLMSGGVHEHGEHSHGAQFFRDADGNVATQFRVTEPDGTVTTHSYKLDANHAKAVEASGVPIEDITTLKAPVQGTTSGAATADGLMSSGEKLMQPKLSLQQQAILEAQARDTSHYGGVNHINMYDVPTFFEAVRQPRNTPPTFMQRITGPFRRALGLGEATAAGGEVKAPDVVRYNDGDYKAMVAHLDQLTDTTGKRPVIQLNHPRYSADWNSNLPDQYRGRDYGIKSFKNIGEWREQFGKYASQIEIITGEAMNPSPIDVMRTTDLGPINMAGYIDKGLHVSPTFGRDDHFNMPGGRPAGTETYVSQLNKEGLLDAMRERRTTATTSTDKLSGYMTVNDKYFMGQILDQNAVPDLNIKMHVSGNVDPAAAYKVSLYGDKRIGDGKLARPLQELSLKGQDILDTHGQVAFDQVQHTLGNKGAYYVEVQRVDPVSMNTDFLWTAPVWVEPVSSIHSPFLRGIVGAGTDSVFGF